MNVSVARVRGFCVYFLKMLLIFSELLKGEEAFLSDFAFLQGLLNILLRYASYVCVYATASSQRES